MLGALRGCSQPRLKCRAGFLTRAAPPGSSRQARYSRWTVPKASVAGSGRSSSETNRQRDQAQNGNAEQSANCSHASGGNERHLGSMKGVALRGAAPETESWPLTTARGEVFRLHDGERATTGCSRGVEEGSVYVRVPPSLGVSWPSGSLATKVVFVRNTGSRRVPLGSPRATGQPGCAKPRHRASRRVVEARIDGPRTCPRVVSCCRSRQTVTDPDKRSRRKPATRTGV